MSYPIIRLKEKKEANVAFRHPWVFSGALDGKPDAEHGDLITLADRKGDVLATATYSTKSSIAARVFALGDVVIDQAWFVKRFQEADAARHILGYGPKTDTTGYRVIFGESDGVPGLVVDRYDDVLVIQVSTAGIEKLKEAVLDALTEVFKPRAIVERSDISARKDEGLKDFVGVLHGEVDAPVAFKEHGLKFEADVLTGQKTGFFLDQKELRLKIQELAKDRTVLNVFSYTGASGVYALKGGAELVHNVDSSASALAGCLRHAELNKLDLKSFTTEEVDAFQYLAKDGESFDMVLLDPPALIKSRTDAEEGKKAYHFLNRAAMRRVRDGGIFVTSSCSHFMPEEDLAFTLRRASVQNEVILDCLGTFRQAADHPLSVYFPEAQYLKSYIFRVRKA
jgi:23S rRNA (cytosine1962-C5)-methyltransferase